MVAPGTTRAEMYVEAYLGGVQGASTSMDVTSRHFGTFPFDFTERHNIPGRLSPSVLGGVKVGTWFVKEGFLGFDYPDWMKYLGFYLDFNYHRLNFKNQTGSTSAEDNVATINTGATQGVNNFNNFKSEGSAATLAFMFAARYGFLPDAEAPFGRLQPYIAVGPAILFASQTPQLFSESYDFFTPAMLPYGVKPGSASSTVIALALEAGVRFMCLKNVSLDVSFKYRYAQPSFDYNYFDNLGVTPGTRSLSLNPTYNLFSGQVGVAYHF